MKQSILIFMSLILSFTARSTIEKSDYLEKCWTKQVEVLNGSYLVHSYQEKLNELYHSSEPWQQLNFIGNGTIWCTSDGFLKQDTLMYAPLKVDHLKVD